MLRHHLEEVTRHYARGWAFSEDGSPVEVEAWGQGECLARGTPRIERPDVHAVFPDRPGSLVCGFLIAFDSAKLGEIGSDVVQVKIWAKTGAVSTTLGEMPIYNAGVLSRYASDLPKQNIDLSPFPHPVINTINRIYPRIRRDENWEMEVVEKVASLADCAYEAPAILGYFRFLRAVWAHAQFVERYFPKVNSGRSSADKDFTTKGTSPFELMSIAHQIYVLRSYGVAGDVAEFGCFKGFSTSVLSYACDLLGVRMHVFDSFEGLPSSNSGYYRTGDFKGDEQEVRQNIRRFGSPDLVTTHKGYFNVSLSEADVPPLMLIWMDVDLESSATDVMSIADRLDPRGNIFSHECASSNFVNGEIVAARAVESVIPPIVEKFTGLGARLRGAHVYGALGAFWREARGCPVLGARALQALLAAV